jgi:hypothetical protein
VEWTVTHRRPLYSSGETIGEDVAVFRFGWREDLPV